MTRPLRTLQPATDEFTTAVQWYEEQRAGLGAEFFDAVTDATTRVHSEPEVGTPLAADQRTRRMLVDRFPYQVVYRLFPDEIVIVAVAHLKRRPGYWKKRT